MFYDEVVLKRGELAEGELRIVVRELPLADGVHGSTGNQHWPAGTVLAQQLLARPQLVKGRRVADLGAGCGLAGFAALALGASRAVLTDGDAETVGNLQHNVQANLHLWDADREVTVKQLCWQDAESWPEEERVDLVVSSDTVYGHFGGALARCALGILAAGGTLLLVAPEDRRAGVPDFLACMQKAGYSFSESCVRELDENFRIYELVPIKAT